MTELPASYHLTAGQIQARYLYALAQLEQCADNDERTRLLNYILHTDKWLYRMVCCHHTHPDEPAMPL